MLDWSELLKTTPPPVLFMQIRHPIARLISAWNNILCRKNCVDDERIQYSYEVLERTNILGSV